MYEFIIVKYTRIYFGFSYTINNDRPCSKMYCYNNQVLCLYQSKNLVTGY